MKRNSRLFKSCFSVLYLKSIPPLEHWNSDYLRDFFLEVKLRKLFSHIYMLLDFVFARVFFFLKLIKLDIQPKGLGQRIRLFFREGLGLKK